jgi:hypothetical protein
LIKGFSTRKVLEKRCSDPAFLENRIHLIRPVNQSEKVRLGEKFQKCEKHLFPAPHSRHPIMNDGDFQSEASFLGLSKRRTEKSFIERFKINPVIGDGNIRNVHFFRIKRYSKGKTVSPGLIKSGSPRTRSETSPT